jgi:ABC-2 type transport system ATP-binding protein
MSAIETRGLRKQFGEKVAVRHLTLCVKQGEVFGFLGANGAGKTTSIKMLLGLVSPTNGEARVLGEKIGDTKTRAKIGFLPEHFRFHDWLTGREFLRFHGRLFGMSGNALDKRIEKLLTRVDLTDAGNRPLKGYSKGMLQRVGLAQALLNTPHLVFLDEPTSGLDPLGRLLVRDIINELRASGTCVFLNSHLLSEVEITCDRVSFVKQGEIVREAALNETNNALEVELRLGNVTRDIERGLSQYGRDVRRNGETITLCVDDESRVPIIATWLAQGGAQIYHLAARKRSLEAIFLEVLGEERPG